MSAIAHAPKVSLVVAYDVMREAANRLVAGILDVARTDGTDAAIAAAVVEVGKIRDRVDAVDAKSLAAIQSLDADLRAEYAELPPL